jgi:hypothetical protein
MNNEHPEIPPGFYCYQIVRIDYGPKTEATAALAQVFGSEDKGEVRLITKPCPYWKCDPTRPEQANGICEFLGLRDWADGTLLWDQVKECNENIDIDDPLQFD